VSRIIAGSRRGRRLQTPPGDATRPTTDRVREALFSALASWSGTAAAPVEESLAGLGFLDLYAGSGAVGLEAASRGAGPVLLVESDARTAATARRNVGDLALPASVRSSTVETLARSAADRAYDVVFADPPYALGEDRLDAVVGDLLGHGWVASDGLLVLERSSRTTAPTWPDAVGDSWTRAYGETVLHFASVGP
jgi:16S rRNA (guanine966-N2)-methyltransferase